MPPARFLLGEVAIVLIAYAGFGKVITFPWNLPACAAFGFGLTEITVRAYRAGQKGRS